MTVADASTTYFTINAGGIDKTVSIYALSEALPGQADADARHAFVLLSEMLGDIATTAAPGTLTGVEGYDPALYRTAIFEGYGEPAGEAIAWPWANLSLADFPQGDEPGREKVLTRSQVAKLTDVPNGGQLQIWVKAPDGSLVTFAVRPLLPDEIAAYEAATASPLGWRVRPSCTCRRNAPHRRTTRSASGACGSRAWYRRWGRCGAWPGAG